MSQKSNKRAGKRKLVSISDLAKICKADRNTVKSYLDREKLEPVTRDGKSMLYDEEAGVRAVQTHQATWKRGPNIELREEKLREEIRRIRLENDERAELFVTKAAHKAEIDEMSSECRRVLYAIPRRAPELEGLQPAGIEQKLRDWIDEAVRTLHDHE